MAQQKITAALKAVFKQVAELAETTVTNVKAFVQKGSNYFKDNADLAQRIEKAFATYSQAGDAPAPLASVA